MGSLNSFFPCPDLVRQHGWKRTWQAGSHLATKFYCFFFFFLRFHLFIFRESGKEREREGEKHQCVVVSHTPPTGDLACNPGMCPDWELTRLSFGSQAATQSTEPHQPGPNSILMDWSSFCLMDMFCSLQLYLCFFFFSSFLRALPQTVSVLQSSAVSYHLDHMYEPPCTT